jgi:hypothetical protein
LVSFVLVRILASGKRLLVTCTVVVRNVTFFGLIKSWNIKIKIPLSHGLATSTASAAVEITTSWSSPAHAATMMMCDVDMSGMGKIHTGSALFVVVILRSEVHLFCFVSVLIFSRRVILFPMCIKRTNYSCCLFVKNQARKMPLRINLYWHDVARMEARACERVLHAWIRCECRSRGRLFEFE